ncbi:MAG: hypothetical protein J6R26_04100 [Paludibacteraceae bacterium]|nr:hypothetical protein [Paludibacteraceae bacterium]
MKKILSLFMLGIAFVFSSCEQPQAPQSLIGHWDVKGDHWTVTFKEDGELYISSTKYDFGEVYYYRATSDSVYVSTMYYHEDVVIYGREHAYPYYFKNNNTVVLDGFNYVYEKPLGTITQNRVDPKTVILTRSSVH